MITLAGVTCGTGDTPARASLALELARDAAAASLEERSAALSETAVAEAQLPDPELRFGAVNLPVDSFALDNEPMTQLLVGLRQRFPQGDTLRLRREQARSMSAAEARANGFLGPRALWFSDKLVALIPAADNEQEATDE